MLGIFRKATSGSASITGLCIKLVLKKLLEKGDFEFVPCYYSSQVKMNSTFRAHIRYIKVCDWLIVDRYP